MATTTISAPSGSDALAVTAGNCRKDQTMHNLLGRASGSGRCSEYLLQRQETAEVVIQGAVDEEVHAHAALVGRFLESSVQLRADSNSLRHPVSVVLAGSSGRSHVRTVTTRASFVVDTVDYRAGSRGILISRISANTHHPPLCHPGVLPSMPARSRPSALARRDPPWTSSTPTWARAAEATWWR